LTVRKWGERKVVPKPPQSEPRVIKEGEQPVKKKKPYYRKKYNKPTPVEVVIPEPTKSNTFITGFTIGVIVGIILTSIIETIIN